GYTAAGGILWISRHRGRSFPGKAFGFVLGRVAPHFSLIFSIIKLAIKACARPLGWIPSTENAPVGGIMLAVRLTFPQDTVPWLTCVKKSSMSISKSLSGWAWAAAVMYPLKVLIFVRISSCSTLLR